MAPPTPPEFRAEFPAFRLLSDTVVQAKLDVAYRRVGDSWGALRDDGAKYLAAHLLSVDPMAEPSAKSTRAGNRTTYLDEYERMLQQARIFGTVAAAPVALPPGD